MHRRTHCKQCYYLLRSFRCTGFADNICSVDALRLKIEEKPRKHLQRFSFLRNGCVSKMLKFENKFSISSSSHPKPYGRNLFRDKPRHLVPVRTLIWIWIYELQIWNWLRKRNYKLWVLNYASKKRNQLVSPSPLGRDGRGCFWVDIICAYCALVHQHIIFQA